VAIDLLEGFESQVATTGGLFQTISGTLVGAGGRTGGYLQCDSGVMQWVRTLDTAHITQRLAFGWRTHLNGSAAAEFLRFRGDGGTVTHVVLEATFTGVLQVRRGVGGTVLASTPTNTVLVNVWHHIEMAVTISDTVGTVELWVDSVKLIDISNQDTRNAGASANLDQIAGGLLLTTYGDMDFDDLIIATNHGTQLGECKVYERTLTGNGNYSQLLGSDGNSTDNYLLTDDVAPPSLTDYAGSATAGQHDTYAVQDLPASVPTGATIPAVEWRSYAGKSDAGAKFLKPMLRRASTDHVAASQAVVQAGSMLHHIFETDPIAAGAWTVSNVNACEYGGEVSDT